MPLLRLSKPLLLAAAAFIAVEVVGRLARLPLAPASGLAITVAAFVYATVHVREER
jgi:hypothetical protein